MRRRFAKPLLVIVVGLVTALLFFPMLLNGNQPRLEAVAAVGKANPEFIRQLAPHAQRLGKAYGVRPSILLAQASLETDYGRNLLGAKYHNLYGLTLSEGQGVKVTVLGQGKEKSQVKTYQVYRSWEDSLTDYLVRLKSGEFGKKGLYNQLATAKTLEQATRVLVDRGYRDDKAYAQQLLAIIKEQKLEEYDKD